MASPTFYLLHGDDDLALEEAVNRLRAGMGDGAEAELNTSTYDGEQASVAEVINAARSFPFLSDKRLVIVRGLISHLTRKGAGETGRKNLDLLLNELPELPAHARFVMVERQNLRTDSAIARLATEHPNGYHKPFKTPEDSTGWIIQRARTAYETEIDPSAAAALASVTVGDLRRADNELIKLVAYVAGERPIQEADVALLTPYVAEANVFNMVDALAAGDGRQALNIMNTALDQDPSDPGFRLFGLIVRQFRLILLARAHLDQGGSTRGRDLQDALNIKSSWQVEKVARQSRAFTQRQLEDIYRRLQQYDVEMKTGQIPPRLALDLLVASLARTEMAGRPT